MRYVAVATASHLKELHQFWDVLEQILRSSDCSLHQMSCAISSYVRLNKDDTILSPVLTRTDLETYRCADTHKYAVAVRNTCIAVQQDAVP